ncbi:hypothetical protein G6F31_021443 [Rhizopus arrhizus]|nr:hypothetical protein G6F31_021443 [Rhizopus arrhizus]
MIPVGHEFCCDGAQSPANHRCDRFDHTEDHAGAQSFGQAGLVQGGAFADGGRERVRRHGERKNNEGEGIHGERGPTGRERHRPFTPPSVV